MAGLPHVARRYQSQETHASRPIFCPKGQGQWNSIFSNVKTNDGYALMSAFWGPGTFEREKQQKKLKKKKKKKEHLVEQFYH